MSAGRKKNTGVYRLAFTCSDATWMTALPEIFLSDLSAKAWGTLSSPWYILVTLGLTLPLSSRGMSSLQIRALS